MNKTITVLNNDKREPITFLLLSNTRILVEVIIDSTNNNETIINYYKININKHENTLAAYLLAPQDILKGYIAF